MPILPRKEVEEIALYARLHLESEEIEKMRVELGAILDHFTALAAVDTDVAPMTHAVPLPAEDAVRAAPAKEGQFFVVPAILPGDS
jgi:aspartyl/glutamyl-tRNA(Asn/Gln) amidotransferase C subunit